MTTSPSFWTFPALAMVLVMVSASPVIQKTTPQPEDPSFEDDLTHTTAAISLPDFVDKVDDLSDVPDAEFGDSDGPKVYSLHVRSDVKFRYATTLVTSRVVNRESKPAEVVFQFVLPEKAFISGFLMEVKGNVYKAYVKEKEEAKKEYQAAIERGQTAAHVAVSARDSNLFAVSVNLEPRSKMTFNLTYEELLSRRLGLYDIVVHLVTCNKVIHDMKVDVSINELQKITTVKVPEPTMGNEVGDAVSGLVEIMRGSTSVLVTYAPTREQQQELLGRAKNDTSIDQHFVEETSSQRLRVQYDVDHHSAAGDILLNDGYFVHFFAPAENSVNPIHRLNKHVIFVLDTSGSMNGRKIQQLQEAMMIILDALEDNKDHFSIVQFSESAMEWSPREKNLKNGQGVYLVTSQTIKEAKKYINTMVALGGTNIGEALDLALKIAAHGVNNKPLYGMQSGNVITVTQPIVIFLTDGEPTVGERNQTVILAGTRALNSETRAPIFSLSFGDYADFTFLRKLSLQNYAFARKIYEAADATLQLKSFFQEISSPLLNNVTFSYVGPKVDQLSLTQSVFHTYFSGTEIVIVGRLNGAAFSSNDVGGMVSSSHYAVPLPASSSETNTAAHESVLPEAALQNENLPSFQTATTRENSQFRIVVEHDILHPDALPPTTLGRENHESKLGSLERLWAFLTIRQLLDQDLAMEEDQTISTAQMRPAKQKALQLALKYGFVTPLTSLVVVKPLEKAESVPSSEGSKAIKPIAMRNNFYLRTPSHSMSGGSGNTRIYHTAHSAAFSSNVCNGTKILLIFMMINTLFKL